MTSRWARVTRGQFVAVFATFIAAFSHGTADGGNPSWVAVALALAFSSLACVFLSSARLSRWRLAASVAISQLLYHGLFSLFGTASTTASGIAAAPHHGPIVFAPVPGAAVVAAPFDPWMLVAHIAAAFATYGLLLRGERALAGISALAILILAVLLRWMPEPPPAVLPQVRVPTGHRVSVPSRLDVLTSALSHRGPPRALPCA